MSQDGVFGRLRGVPVRLCDSVHYLWPFYTLPLLPVRLPATYSAAPSSTASSVGSPSSPFAPSSLFLMFLFAYTSAASSLASSVFSFAAIAADTATSASELRRQWLPKCDGVWKG